MIPSESMQGDEWDSIIINYSNNDINIWSQLASCFGLKRVARKASVDKGPMRESRVILLYPSIDSNEDNDDKYGPDSLGWVTVFENKIAVSFDITRVMFCSGNGDYYNINCHILLLL
jgi:hypothetical protein